MNEIEQSSLSKIEAEITILKHQTAQNIIEIGRRLIQAKEMLPHGRWLPWLEEKAEFSERTARNFMRVAREFPNRHAIAELGQSKVFALGVTPENIDEKLKIAKVEFYRKVGELEMLEKISV